MEEFGCLASTPTFSSTNSLGRRSATRRAGLQGCAKMGFLVLLIMSLLASSVTMELAGSMKTATLVHLAGPMGLSPQENLLMCSAVRV